MIGQTLTVIYLDHEISKHFRPISNLSYISKLVELIVDSQFEIYMVEKGPNDPMQSAYFCLPEIS